MATNTTTIRSENSLKRFTSPARWARMEERAEARRRAQSGDFDARYDLPQTHDWDIDAPVT